MHSWDSVIKRTELSQQPHEAVTMICTGAYLQALRLFKCHPFLVEIQIQWLVVHTVQNIGSIIIRCRCNPGIKHPRMKQRISLPWAMPLTMTRTPLMPVFVSL